MNFMEWVRKNPLTLLGILFILLVVVYNQTTIESQKQEVLDSCNEYYMAEIERVCPMLNNPMGYSNAEGGLFVLNVSSDFE